MRIINKEEFLALPANTFYMEYDPYCFGELQIKRGTIDNNDFRLTPLFSFDYDSTRDMHDKLQQYEDLGSSFDLNLLYQERDAYYNDEQLYVVYEESDLLQLQDEVLKALGNFKED